MPGRFRAGTHIPIRGIIPYRVPGAVFIVAILSDVTSPTYGSGEEGDQSNAIVAIIFSEAVQSSNFTTGVTIKIDGVSATVASAALQANLTDVYYTLASPWAVSNSVVTFTYSDIAGDIRDISNNQLGDITTAAVTNNVGRHERYNDAPNSFHLAYI